MSEQRLFLRKKVPLPIPIELLPGKEMWLHDIGEGGLSVSGSSRLEPGTATFFSFQFPDANSIIEASGVVAWCDGSGRVGIRFTRIKPDSSAVLKRWLKSEEMPPASPASPVPPEPYRGRTQGDAAILREEIARAKLDSSSALDLLAERMKDRTRASGAAIALREGDCVVCGACSGNAPPSGTTLSIDGTATGDCYRSGNIVSITDTENDPRVNAELCRRLEFRSLLIVPVATSEQIVGIAEVFSPVQGNFEGGDILLLGSIAEVVAEIYGARQRKPDSPMPETTGQISVLESDCAQEQPRGAAPVEAKAGHDPRAGATSGTSITEEVAVSRNDAEQDAPEPSPQPMENLADDQRPQEDTSRWKPRNYLLLMVGLTALGVGMGDLADWHLTSRLARSRPHPAGVPTSPAADSAAANQPKTGDELTGARTDQPLSTAEFASTTLHGASQDRLAKLQKTSIALKSVAADPRSSAISAGSQSASSPAFSAAVPLAGTIPNLDPRTMAQLTPAKLLHRVEPVVPDFAKSSGLQATVLLSAIIGTDGKLKDVKFVSGDRALAVEAFRAVRDWRYRPYLLNGKPIEAETRIVMDFKP